jgi:hypothetical protein
MHSHMNMPRTIHEYTIIFDNLKTFQLLSANYCHIYTIILFAKYKYAHDLYENSCPQTRQSLMPCSKRDHHINQHFNSLLLFTTCKPHYISATQPTFLPHWTLVTLTPPSTPWHHHCCPVPWPHWYSPPPPPLCPSIWLIAMEGKCSGSARRRKKQETLKEKTMPRVHRDFASRIGSRQHWQQD